MTDAERIYVSPISLFEIGLTVRAQKWPEMAAVIDDLIGYLAQQNAQIAELNPSICLAAGRLEWAHRDPFDRMLAATALHYQIPLVSADTMFDGVVERIW